MIPYTNLTKDIMNKILKNHYYLLTLLLCTGSAFAALDDSSMDRQYVVCKEFSDKPLKDFLLTNNPLIQNGQYSPDEQRQIRDTYNSFQPFRAWIVQDSKVEYKDFIQNPLLIAQFFRDPKHAMLNNSLYHTHLLMDAVTLNALPTIRLLIQMGVDVEYHCVLALAEESGNPEILKLIYAQPLQYRANFLINRLSWGALVGNNSRRFCFIFNCYPVDPQTQKPVTITDFENDPRIAAFASTMLTFCQQSEGAPEQFATEQPADVSSNNQANGINSISQLGNGSTLKPVQSPKGDCIIS